jgi:hypothetical protein
MHSRARFGKRWTRRAAAGPAALRKESTMRLTRCGIAQAMLLASMIIPRAGAGGQVPFLVEGLIDGEGWSTTRNSNLLTRNHGNPAVLGRAQLWGAVEALPGLIFYGQGEAVGGSARPSSFESRTDVYGDQYGVRYSGWHGLMLDAGKVQPVIGTFAPRHFSNRNPLIGTPDAYSLDYPLGAVLSGDFRHADFRAGVVTLPPTHAGYEPTPTPRLRPAVGAGITPVIGVRLGGSWTEGPYLNDALTPVELRSQPWTQYHQRVFALDARAAHGYLETYAEAARATYDVPGRAGAILGYTYYGEAKYTFTPRFYVATRAERNAYPFIRASAANWTARRVDFVNGELGVGYRAAASTLLKLSLRGDRWWVARNAPGFLGQGGPAVAFQISQSVDVKRLLTPKR